MDIVQMFLKISLVSNHPIPKSWLPSVVFSFNSESLLKIDCEIALKAMNYGREIDFVFPRLDQ